MTLQLEVLLFKINHVSWAIFTFNHIKLTDIAGVKKSRKNPYFSAIHIIHFCDLT
jgi:hypothetical protein